MKKTIALLISVLGIWAVASLGEIYEHNAVTFNKGNHEYSNWNMFIIIFEEANL